ncbi:T9SS type A sorting domain-containing protein [Reichenbachiella sp.]|uniref:T9SS type A sorting domain-containing protein n=1 Tax=Reichenbachiella sp. TaxID=2184521 RepID=UPI003296A2AE
MAKYKIQLITLLVLSVAFWPSLQGQEVINANISDLIGTEINNLPGASTNVYASPGGSDLTAWEGIIDLILDKNFSEVANKATDVGYTLSHVKDNTGSGTLDLYLLRRTSGSNYWGTYVFNNDPDRAQLVIQSPHAIKDTNTGLEGVYVFRQTGARAFFLTGTNRCNSSTKTSCSGTTSVCGSGSEKYRISDVAHNDKSAFQIVTEKLNDAESNYFIQLHGFSKKSTDPYVIMSLGARGVNGTNKLPDIQQALFEQDAVLTFQSSTNTSWTRLLGFTNTQGRYINQSSNPCSNDAAIANGRFIHLEQELSRLRSGTTQWSKMAEALAAAFPSQKTVTAVGDQGFHELAIHLFPNPVNHQLTVHNELGNNLKLKMMTLDGRTVLSQVIDLGTAITRVDYLDRGVYLYQISDHSKLVKSGKLIKH